MSATDVLVRLLFNTSDFDRNLGKTKKEVGDMGKGFKSLGSSAGAAFKGIAGAAGVAFGAVETFDRIIKANETNNDKWENTMRAVNNSVNEFFSAITSGDFSVMSMGLGEIIEKARETAEALRQIEDATTVFGYFGGRNSAEFSKQINVLRDKSASPEAKAAAMEAAKSIMADQREMITTLSDTAWDAVSKMFTQRSTLSADSFTPAELDKILYDATLSSKKGVKTSGYESAYAEYVKELEKLNEEYTTLITTSTMYGNIVQTVTDYEDPAYQKELASLQEMYKYAILYNAVWEKTNGEEFKQAVSLLQQIFGYSQNLAGMEGRILRYGQSGTASVKAEEIAPEGSIRDLENRLKDLNDQLALAATDAARAEISALISEITVQLDRLKKDAHRRGLGIYRDPNVERVDAGLRLPNGLQSTDLGMSIRDKDSDSGNWVPEFNRDLETTEDRLSAVASLMQNLSGLVGEGAATWLSYGANILQTVGQAIPAIASLTLAKQQEASANAFSAATGAGSAVASIPIVGPVMAIAAIASIIAAIAAIPKFAEGGVVPGSSYYGDKVLARLNSGEVVLNRGQQIRLLQELDKPRQSIAITGELVARGRDLVYVFNRQNQYSAQ